MSVTLIHNSGLSSPIDFYRSDTGDSKATNAAQARNTVASRRKGDTLDCVNIT